MERRKDKTLRLFFFSARPRAGLCPCAPAARPRVSKKYPPHSIIRDAFTFQPRQQGDLYLLVRLEGQTGTWQQGVIGLSAFDPVLLQKSEPHPADGRGPSSPR